MFGMTRCWRCCGFQLALASWSIVGGASTYFGNCALAQIKPDGTLGDERSVVTPNVNIKGVPSDRIDGGAIRGANLFHSFQEFNVGEGRGAYFSNPVGIENILGRVTGNDRTEILGKLGVLGNANLFLINPNGIIFGPNASLDVGGSFLASTASSVNFADGTQFSATARPTTPLLTVSVPLGLQFGGNAGRIINQSQATNSSGEVGLEVQPDKTLALVGGDIWLDGGNLQAPGGRVELGGVADSGTVGLNVNGNNLRLSFPVGVRRADVSLTNGAFVDVIAGGGGSIAISAQNLDVLEGSELVAGIGSGLGSVGSQAGNITLDAIGAMKIAGSSIANDVRFGAVGNAGSILIKAGTLSLDDGAFLSASTFGQGNAGEIFVEANNSVSIAANSEIVTRVQETGAGNGGDIKILAGDLFLTAGSLLETNTFGEGRAGNVIIDARDTVSVENSLISSETFGLRDGGIIDIMARALSLTEGAELLSRTTGEGNAGNIQVNASDSVSISGVNPQKGFSSGLITETVEEDSGLGGDISVTTGALRVLDGAVLSARTLNASGGGNITVDVNTLEAIKGGQLLTTAFSSGHAGNITVKASDSVTLSGSDPTYAARLDQFKRERVDPDSPASGLSARTEGTGAAGNLRIATGQLIVRDRAQVSASTEGQGPAGTLEVTAPAGLVELIGSGSSLTTETRGAREAGNLIITTGQVRVQDGAKISASTFGIGQGGNLTVTAPESVTLSGGGSLSAQATGSGNAGDLTINTRQLTVQDRAEISASTISGQGGDITLRGLNSLQVSESGRISASTETGRAGSLNVNPNENAADSVELRGQSSGLFTRAAGGDAGDLMINTLALTVQDGAEVSASTSSGRGGDITLGGLNSLQVSNGGQISASTETGRAGSLNVNPNENAADSVELRSQGSGLFARASRGGDAGGLTINALAFTVADGAEATVSSQEGQAGNLRVAANSILLDQGRLSAVTAKSQPGTEGANITLQVRNLLLMGNESRISADALNAANGGNIKIGTKFLIAPPSQGPSGSDIAANAFKGNGGKLDITASGIFGISFRPEETPLNDITASSKFGLAGVVEINTPDVDLSRGLVNLPTQPTDTEIVQACQPGGSQQQSEFVITGRGGLPLNPSEALSSDAIQVDWVTLNLGGEDSSIPAVSTNPTAPVPEPIVEAQGWIIGPNGEVVLTAQAPTVTPHSSWQTPSDCHAPENSS